jgi:hypothetical protein
LPDDAGYSILFYKELDLEIFTLIPGIDSMVESLARTISNLSRWYLKVLFLNISKSSNYNINLNILHILNKLRYGILKKHQDPGNVDTHG